jgi:hypothetical protein
MVANRKLVPDCVQTRSSVFLSENRAAVLVKANHVIPHRLTVFLHPSVSQRRQVLVVHII